MLNVLFLFVALMFKENDGFIQPITDKRSTSTFLSMKLMGNFDALLFDCDGVIAETERDIHRVTFNSAFQEAGLTTTVWDEGVQKHSHCIQYIVVFSLLLHHIIFYTHRHHHQFTLHSVLALSLFLYFILFLFSLLSI